MVGGVDVFITNYPPGTRGRLGVDYERLSPLNERLIYASFTGYGEQGSEADKPGFDVTAWWARSGLMDTVRTHAEGEPVASASLLDSKGRQAGVTDLSGNFELRLPDSVTRVTVNSVGFSPVAANLRKSDPLNVIR